MNEITTYSEEVKDLLVKIMGAKSIINVAKKDDQLKISFTFTGGLEEADKARDRLQQADIRFDDYTFRRSDSITLPDTQQTIIDLQKKLEEGIVKRFVADIEKSSVGSEPKVKEILAKRVLEAAAKNLKIDLGKPMQTTF